MGRPDLTGPDDRGPGFDLGYRYGRSIADAAVAGWRDQVDGRASNVPQLSSAEARDALRATGLLPTGPDPEPEDEEPFGRPPVVALVVVIALLLIAAAVLGLGRLLT